MALCHEQNIFGTNHYYYFHLPIGPFHCAKFKKVLTADPELSECTIFGPKMVHLPQTSIFFGKLLISFSYTYQPLSLCKMLKKFLGSIQSYEDVPFLGPKCSICPTQNFFGKLLISLSPTYQPLSLCKILKKFLEPTQSQEDVQFLGPKWPISPNENFFRKIFK